MSLDQTRNHQGDQRTIQGRRGQPYTMCSVDTGNGTVCGTRNNPLLHGSNNRFGNFARMEPVPGPVKVVPDNDDLVES